MNTIPYGRHSINEEDIAEVVKVLQSDYLTQGPNIEAFEKAFAKYVGADYALAVNNGTTALHLCMVALDVKPGDKILSTPISFVATSNAVHYCGGTVEFVDINPDTILLDEVLLREKLESEPKRTYKGIVVVDFAGYPAQLEKLKNIADEFGMWLVEDACHAPGAAFTNSEGTKIKSGSGQYADLSVFSFHPVKHIACGEGGMITTNDKSLYDRFIILRTHGITKDPTLLSENHGGWYYEMQELGFNYRITDIQSALGLSQLKRAEDGLQKRRTIAQKYDKIFSDVGINYIQCPEDIEHAYHLYIIQIDNRRELYDYLRTKGIYAQVHYIPIHLMPFYKEQGFKKGMYPNAEKYYDRCLSLPMFPTLTDAEQTKVTDCVLEFHSVCA